MKTLQNEDGSPASVLTYFISTLDSALYDGQKASIILLARFEMKDEMKRDDWHAPVANCKTALLSKIGVVLSRLQKTAIARGAHNGTQGAA